MPFLIIFAPAWGWIVFANVLLGINQGLCWSTTVIMKIDLVGPARRGLAMGLNEAAGYVAVSLAAIAAGYLAATYALRPQPFLPGVGFALAGLLLSLFFVRESHGHARHEAALLAQKGRQTPQAAQVDTDKETDPSFREIFWLASWKNRTLFSVSQAELVNNLNDGLAWGLFPLFFVAGDLSIAQVGLLAGIYPGVWGVTQLLTGALSDRLGRKGMIVGGMILQGCAIVFIPLIHGFVWWVISMVLLGLGTALVYPTLLAAVSDVAHPSWRASAVGVYRLWRDSGYSLGALLAGVLMLVNRLITEELAESIFLCLPNRRACQHPRVNGLHMPHFAVNVKGILDVAAGCSVDGTVRIQSGLLCRSRSRCLWVLRPRGPSR